MKNLLLIISIISFIACNKIDCPNEDGCVEPINPCINAAGLDTCQNCINLSGIDTCLLLGSITEHHSDSNEFQKILIEEYTGFKCTNCPDGARKIAELLPKYVDTLVAVSVHAGTFAEPGTTGGHTYSTDFRTEVGDEYNNTFLEPGSPYPSAVINRTKFNDLYVQKKENWESLINGQIASSSANPPILKLHSYYSEESHTVFCDAKIKFKENTGANYGIVFLLIEDDVVDVQLDGGVFIEEYDHKHVLRHALSNHFGDVIEASSIVIGDELTMSSDYLELDASWKAEDCELVAILVDQDSREVKQVQTVHIF